MDMKGYGIVFIDEPYLVLTKRKLSKDKYPNGYYIDEEYPGYKTIRFPPDIIGLDDFIEYIKDEWIWKMTEDDKKDLKEKIIKYDKENKDFIIKIGENGEYLGVEEYNRENIVKELKKKGIKFGLEQWKEIQERIKKEEDGGLVEKIKNIFK